MFTKSMAAITYVNFWIYLIQNAGAYRPSGYLGCYADYRNRVLKGKSHSSGQNSGDYCKRICKDFRYAGTESGHECFCGNYIRVKLQRYGCNDRCPGNRDEYCGGHWQISIYDTWPCANLMPCKNHATCVNIDANTYTCKCSGDWTGRHCDEVKTSPTTTTTTTTTTTKTTRATTKATSSHIMDITTVFSTSYKEAVNATYIPETAKDDDENLLIVLYVLVPLAVILTVIVLTVFLHRRRHKNQVQVLYKAQGSLSNIYANLASLNNTPFVNVQIHADDAVRKENIKAETTVKDINTEEEIKYHDHIYVNMPVENTDEYMHSYDHISALKKSAVNETYSKLSETKSDNKHVLNTNYSHIEERYRDRGVIDDSKDDGVTYNRLNMRINMEDGPRNAGCDADSEYDHTDGEHVLTNSNIKSDDYSHLSDREFTFQRARCVNNTTSCHSFEKAEYVDEEEYACVTKSPKTRK